MITVSALLLLVAVLPAEPAKESDISCKLAGSYTGNAISPVFRLKIGNLGKPEWTYSSSDDMFSAC